MMDILAGFIGGLIGGFIGGSMVMLFRRWSIQQDQIRIAFEQNKLQEAYQRLHGQIHGTLARQARSDKEERFNQALTEAGALLAGGTDPKEVVSKMVGKYPDLIGKMAKDQLGL